MSKWLPLFLLLTGCAQLSDQVENAADGVDEYACGWDRESSVCPAGDPPDAERTCVVITSGPHTVLAPYGTRACDVVDNHAAVLELGECVAVFTQRSARVTPVYQMDWIACPSH